MSGALNQVNIIGRLGKDPELRYTESGVAVANLSIATSDKWTDRDGQKQERTEWHRVVAWDKLAEVCGKYLAKGRLVYVTGKLQTRKWEDRDGNKRYTTEIRAHQVLFLESKKTAEQSSGKTSGGEYDYGPPPMDDDIPF